jgi:hypothetical protein
MATIILPGKKSVKVQERQTPRELKLQGLLPEACRLVRKDPQTGAIRQIQDADPIAGEDLVFAVPRHVQGDDGNARHPEDD